MKKVKVKVAQSCLILCDPMDYTVHGILQARILEWIPFPFSRGSSQPRSPALQVDSLPAEPQGKPKNTGVGSLPLLHRSFPTQELKWGLPHCRQILYQLSYKGSPRILEWVAYLFSSRSSQPRNQTRVSCIGTDSLPTELSGKPKDTRVGSLSLLQGIFPTQELNQSVLHCRWILYQLSSQGRE